MSTKVYNEEQLTAHLQQLLPAGYSMNQYGQFVKTEPHRSILLSLGYAEFFPFGVYFSGFGAGICFHRVEEILHEVYVNHPNLDWGHNIDSDTFSRSFSHSVLGRDFFIDNVYEVQVEDDATFNQVKPYLQQMINAALAFLEEYQTLQDFYDLSEPMTLEEKANFYSPPMPPRRLIVKKLLNQSYIDLAQGDIDYYVQEGDNAEASFAQDLKNHLDNL